MHLVQKPPVRLRIPLLRAREISPPIIPASGQTTSDVCIRGGGDRDRMREACRYVHTWGLHHHLILTRIRLSREEVTAKGRTQRKRRCLVRPVSHQTCTNALHGSLGMWYLQNSTGRTLTASNMKIWMVSVQHALCEKDTHTSYHRGDGRARWTF